MTGPITATFAVIFWANFAHIRPIPGVTWMQNRASSIYRVTFKSQADKDAFPAGMKADIEARGGELILCQEIEGKYD